MKYNKKQILALVLLCHIPLCKPQLNAGDLDPTFGENGRVVSLFPTLIGSKKIAGLTVHPDGTLFAAGTLMPGPESLIAHYSSTGVFDNTFNNSQGFAKISSSVIHAITIGQGAKLITAGAQIEPPPMTMSVRNFLPNGQLAPEALFDNDNRISIFLNPDTSEAFALTTDIHNRLVVAGYSMMLDNSSFALARLLPNGKPDSTFGINSTLFLPIGNTLKRIERINGIALDRRTGTLYAAGYALINTSILSIVAAFDDHGLSEQRFSPLSRIPGVAELSFASLLGFLPKESRATSIAVQNDNGNTKIVAGGYVNTNRTPDTPDTYALTLVRYNSDGSLDTTFGQEFQGQRTGIRIDYFGSPRVMAHALALDSNNNIIVVGQIKTTDSPVEQFVVARYTPDGQRDIEFGDNGVVTTPFGDQHAVATAIAIDGQDNIVVGGFVTNEDGIAQFALARYRGIPDPQPASGEPGTLDTTFGAAGMVVTTTNGTIFGTAVNQNDTIFVTGTHTTPPNIIASGISSTLSYLSNGKPNPAFTPFIIGGSSFTSSLAVHPNNSLITSGLIATGTGQTNLFLFSLGISNGSYSPTFASRMGNGFFFPPEGSFSVARALAIYPQAAATIGGRIVAAGYTEPTSTTRHFALTRTLSANPPVTAPISSSDGTHDITFGPLGDGGMVVTNFTNTENDFSQINAIALYPPSHQNKVIVAGQALIDNQQRFVLARYLERGILDTTFGALVNPDNPTGPRTGKLVTDFSPLTLVLNRNDRANAVILQTVGNDIKIVAAGSTPRKDGSLFTALTRYNDNGTLDLSFGYTGTGIRINCFGARGSEATAIALDENNNILIAGIVTRPAPVDPTPADPVEQFLVARYNENGRIDTTFGNKGKTFTHFLGEGAGAYSIALQSTGKIILGGFAINNGQRVFALARYHT